MTPFKTILMTAAIMAVPTAAFAQSSATSAKDYAKDQAADAAVDAVMDNATTDDLMVAGKTMIKGGSKEDAAIAVVKNRVDDKIDGLTDGAASMDDLSKDGMMDAGKDMAKDKMMDAVGDHSAAKTYTDKAPSSAATYGSAVISKSGPVMEMTPAAPSTAPSIAAPIAMTPVNCPAGTKGMPDGTCMVTGSWDPS